MSRPARRMESAARLDHNSKPDRERIPEDVELRVCWAKSAEQKGAAVTVANVRGGTAETAAFGFIGSHRRVPDDD